MSKVDRDTKVRGRTHRLPQTSAVREGAICRAMLPRGSRLKTREPETLAGVEVG